MKVTFLMLIVASVFCDALENFNEIPSTELERKLYYRHYGQQPVKFQARDKKYSTMQKGMSHGHKQEESHDEVFIQTLACPGKCLDAELIEGLMTVVHNECNNCDPDQKWRIKKYKGDQVQIEHVNSPGQCVCIGEGAANVPQCDGFPLKLGPCTKGVKHGYYSKYKYWSHEYKPYYGHGTPSELSLFEFTGGRFISTYCREETETRSSMNAFGGVEGFDYCSSQPEADPYVFALEVSDTVKSEEIFMVTSCLVNERKCSPHWW